MKKVLKLVLVLAMLAALTVSAFAASPTTRDVPNNSGAPEVLSVTATGDPDVTVECNAPTFVSANEQAAEGMAEGKIIAVLGSFDIVVTKGDQVLHDGVTVDVTLQFPEEYVGKYLVLLENTDGEISVAFSGVITGTTMTITLTKFSTFTPVVTEAPVQGATSPQTSQSIVPAALICVAAMSLVGVVIATKRKFN